jgi:diguanylate cyclase (GGDEF)-like protein
MNEPFSLATKRDSKTVIITFIPIKNTYEKIAYITLYSMSDYLDALAIERYYSKILIFSIIFLLFLFSIYATNVQRKLREMALFDKLTKLPNRAYFYAELDIEIRHAKRNREKIAVLFIDLDGFKSINDSYGHDIGDELLVQVAQRLKEAIRSVDIVGRIGGDEFTVLVTDVKKSADAELVAQKIVTSISKDFLIKKRIAKIGASIGISIYSDDAQDVDTIMKHADSAMYEVKNSGKNSFVTYKKNNR